MPQYDRRQVEAEARHYQRLTAMYYQMARSKKNPESAVYYQKKAAFFFHSALDNLMLLMGTDLEEAC
jgi:hypothetical protein